MSEPTIIITRPEEDAHALQAQLSALGWDSILSPMLNIHANPDAAEKIEALSDNPLDAVIATSRHALGLCTLPDSLKQQPLYVVGKQTAEAARHIGWVGPIYTHLSVRSLIQKLQGSLPATSSLLYLRGETVKADLPQELPQYSFHSVTIYRAALAEELSADCLALIQSDIPALALFFSTRSALRFQALYAEQPHSNAARDAICQSPAIARALVPGEWREIITAETPTLESMIESLAIYRDYWLKKRYKSS